MQSPFKAAVYLFAFNLEISRKTGQFIHVLKIMLVRNFAPRLLPQINRRENFHKYSFGIELPIDCYRCAEFPIDNNIDLLKRVQVLWNELLYSEKALKGNEISWVYKNFRVLLSSIRQLQVFSYRFSIILDFQYGIWNFSFG